MQILVDTNILVRAVGGVTEERKLAEDAVDRLQKRGNVLVIVPQVLYEWWVVATRPKSANGLGMDPQAANGALSSIEAIFSFKSDRRALFHTWRRLIVDFNIIGKPAHDARLVAAMLVRGINHILTFNVNNFARFPFVTTVSPASIVQASPS